MEVAPTTPAENDILTAEVTELSKCKPSSILQANPHSHSDKILRSDPSPAAPDESPVPSIVNSRMVEVARDNECCLEFRIPVGVQ
jgi:hypothetical protein